MDATRLYETDFYDWTNTQAQLLRAGKFAEIDVENLAEEIEDMGKRQKQELISRLRVLLMHLLKWEYEPTYRSKSWTATIKTQRFDIAEHLEQNPSLKHTLDFAIGKAWKGALVDADETEIDKQNFPQTCPWTFDQFMAEDFWPECGRSEHP